MYKIPSFDYNKYLITQEPDPSRKDVDYFKQNVFAMYSEWVRGLSTIGYEGIYRIDLLRAYAEGKQPDRWIASAEPKRTSALLDLNGNPIPSTEDDLPGYNTRHAVWEILSPANKIMDALEGSLVKFDYDVQCDPLDYNTRHEIEDMKLKAWQYAQNRTKIQLAAQVAGVEVPEPDFIPEQPEDLEQNDEKFLPDHARYVEQIVKHTFDICHWRPDIIKLFYRDLFAHGSACVQDAYDPETGKIIPKWIDPRNADVQTSQYPDHRDSERAWHYELWNLSRVRQYFPDKPEEWFRAIAQNYCGMFDNPEYNMFSTYNRLNPYGDWMYDTFKVAVGCFEWIDIDKSKQVIGTKHGRKTVKEVPLNKKVAQDKTVRFMEDRRRYEAKWVLNTDEVFDYGPAHENSPYLTYHWYTLPGKSKIEQLVPILANFQDLWDKYRELLRNSRGRGSVIDVDKLASTGGDDPPQVAAKKAYRRFLSTYTMFIRRVNAAGMPDQNAPYVETEGGMGSFFQEIMLAFKTNIDMVEYITGLNPMALGQAADPNAPVTTSQMAMNATANVLRPIVEGYMRSKQGVAENVARWSAMLIRGNEFSRRAYESVVGKYGVQALIAASKADADYGFKMIPRPTELEKQWLLQQLQAATTPAQGGEREISTADAAVILNMISAETPVKTVQFYFEKARRKQQQLLMRQKMMLMQQQSQLNQQDAQVSAQTRMAENQAVHAQNMELQGLKNQGVVGNTAVQENLRSEKEKQVQELKNAAEVKEPAIA